MVEECDTMGTRQQGPPGASGPTLNEIDASCRKEIHHESRNLETFPCYIDTRAKRVPYFVLIIGFQEEVGPNRLPPNAVNPYSLNGADRHPYPAP